MKVTKKSVKKALLEPRTLIGIVGGILVGAGTAIFYYERDTLLVITDEDFSSIEHGRTGVYETNHGRVFVRNS